MTAHSLLGAVPDFTAFIRPDGFVTESLGGRDVPFLCGQPSAEGRHLNDILDAESAALVLRLIRRALADRRGTEARFSADGVAYLARVQPQGPQRTLCVIQRTANTGLPEPGRMGPAEAGTGEFHRALDEAVTDARLRERTFALCLVYLDGLSDVGRLIDYSIRQQVLDELVSRLTAAGSGPLDHAGIASETVLGLIIRDGGELVHLRHRAEEACVALSQPVIIGDTRITIAAHMGVSVFGRDASTAEAVTDHATAAMLEARRSGPGTAHFYSDTLRMLPVVRLDFERELRLAIETGQIRLHYSARHDLRSGRITGIHTQLRWLHPIRGEIAPARFLKIAEATDLAEAVSRAALARLAGDLPSLRRRFHHDLPVSFGPLRQHITGGRLLSDFRASPCSDSKLSGCLELRIGERALNELSDPRGHLGALAASGVRWVVDEFGSGATSLTQLPQLPLAGLQISRALVVASLREPAALQSCRAIVALAKALDLPSVAHGIDDDTLRRRLLELGCRHGLGDLFPTPFDDARVPAPGAVANGWTELEPALAEDATAPLSAVSRSPTRR
jgi:predicted signal transduction protein with EAL and GGDEF domain